MHNLKCELEDLLQMVSDKGLLLSDILDITIKQKEALSLEDFEYLLELVNEKQSIIEKINILDQDFLVLYKKHEAVLLSKDYQREYPAEFSLCLKIKSTISNMLGIMENIKKIENENSRTLPAALEKAKANLKKLNTGIKGYSAYKQNMNMASGQVLNSNR